MPKRFPLNDGPLPHTATLLPEFAALYTLIYAKVELDPVVAAMVFIRNIQQIAAGREDPIWVENWYRGKLMEIATNTYSHAA